MMAPSFGPSGPPQYDTSFDANADRSSSVQAQATIKEIYPLVMREKPDTVRQAATGWSDLSTSLSTLSGTIGGDWGKLAPGWQSDAGEVFGIYVTNTTWSIDDWKDRADRNVTGLNTLAAAIEKAQFDMAVMWSDFNRDIEAAEEKEKQGHSLISFSHGWGGILNPSGWADGWSNGWNGYKTDLDPVLEQYTNRAKSEILEPLNKAYSDAFVAVAPGSKWQGVHDGPSMADTVAAMKKMMPKPGGPGAAPAAPGGPGGAGARGPAPTPPPPAGGGSPAPPVQAAFVSGPPPAQPGPVGAPPQGVAAPPALGPRPQPPAGLGPQPQANFAAPGPMPVAPVLGRGPQPQAPPEGLGAPPEGLDVAPQGVGAPPQGVGAGPEGLGAAPVAPLAGRGAPPQGVGGPVSGRGAPPAGVSPEGAGSPPLSGRGSAPGGVPPGGRGSGPGVPRGLAGREGAPSSPPPGSGMRNPPPPLNGRGRGGPGGSGSRAEGAPGEPETPPPARPASPLSGRRGRDGRAVDEFGRRVSGPGGPSGPGESMPPNPSRLGSPRNLQGTRDTRVRWRPGSLEAEEVPLSKVPTLTGRMAGGPVPEESVESAARALRPGLGGRGLPEPGAGRGVGERDERERRRSESEREREAARVDFVGDTELFTASGAAPSVIERPEQAPAVPEERAALRPEPQRSQPGTVA